MSFLSDAIKGFSQSVSSSYAIQRMKGSLAGKEVNNGYGEFLLSKREKEGSSEGISFSVYQKAHTIFKKYDPLVCDPKFYGQRHVFIEKEIKQELGEEYHVHFIPRTLYELLYINLALQEEMQGCDVYTAYEQRNCPDHLKKIKGAVVPKEECMHAVMYQDGQTEIASERHIKMAYKINTLSLTQFQKQTLNFTFINDVTEKTLQSIEKFGDEGKTIGRYRSMITKALVLECSELAQNAILLYRCANLTKDSPLDGKDFRALSFGSGLFAGFTFERSPGGASAFGFAKAGQDRVYTIFEPVKELQERSIFFVPQTDTIHQLNLKGELIHSRIRLYKDISKECKVRPYYGEDREILFTSLRSSYSQDELQKEWERKKASALTI